MTDVFTKDQRSSIMRGIKSKDTKPEMQVRKALHALGLRYRLHVKDLPGKPDLVFPKYKAVIQVRGCFWHGHRCKVDHKPKSNKSYWIPKIENNIARDRKNDAAIKQMGWRLFIVWECECRDNAKFTHTIEQLYSSIVMQT
jgi:DNA mismatch endonuclease (patch repair protein)